MWHFVACYTSFLLLHLTWAGLVGLLIAVSVCDVGNTLSSGFEKVIFDLYRQAVVDHFHRKVLVLRTIRLWTSFKLRLFITHLQINGIGIIEFGDKIEVLFLIGHNGHITSRSISAGVTRLLRRLWFEHLIRWWHFWLVAGRLFKVELSYRRLSFQVLLILSSSSYYRAGHRNWGCVWCKVRWADPLWWRTSMCGWQTVTYSLLLRSPSRSSSSRFFNRSVTHRYDILKLFVEFFLLL